MLKRLKEWYGNLPGILRGLITGAGVLLLAPVLVTMMKLLLGATLVGLMMLLATKEERIGPEHYQYTYNVVEDWNRETLGSKYERENLFGYGKYLYNSHLLLFPRETPSTLDEYYFCWESMGFDVDGFAVYFTCRLDEAAWQGFTQGLADFVVTTPADRMKPLYDTEHFDYPAYILQWLDVGEKWQVLEYILLDEAKHTAVFVYCTIGMEDVVEDHSTYRVTPDTWEILPKGVTVKQMPPNYRYKDGFSIYGDFENAVYDLSFLEYLN
ncbi:MAG: hypothetical protein IJ343_00670 [Clostridia bacterium]|nr:hypothetical protein [Clostridia bacterium]